MTFEGLFPTNLLHDAVITQPLVRAALISPSYMGLAFLYLFALSSARDLHLGLLFLQQAPS